MSAPSDPAGVALRPLLAQAQQSLFWIYSQAICPLPWDVEGRDRRAELEQHYETVAALLAAVPSSPPPLPHREAFEEAESFHGRTQVALLAALPGSSEEIPDAPSVQRGRLDCGRTLAAESDREGSGGVYPARGADSDPEGVRFVDPSSPDGAQMIRDAADLQPTTQGDPPPEDRAALHRLLEQWRADADAEDARLKQYCYGGALDGDMLDEDIEKGFLCNKERRCCADDLEAALAGGGRRAPPPTGRRGVNWKP